MSEHTSEIKRIKAPTSTTSSKTTAIDSRTRAAVITDPTTYINKLPKLLAQHRYSELLEICASLLSIDPKNHIALRNQGHALFMLGDYQSALEGYEAVCKIAPDTQSFCMQGKILSCLGDHQKALERYQMALSLDPSNVNALMGQGDAFLEKDAQKALHSYKKVYDIDPRNFYNLTQMGIALSNAGRKEEALEHLKAAYAINQRYIINLLALGSLLMDLNRPEEALDYYQRASQFSPDDAQAAYSVGMAFHKLALTSKPADEKLKPFYSWDPYGAALKYYERALEIDPEFSESLENRSRLLGQLDKQSVIAGKLKSTKEEKQKAINFSDLPLTKSDIYHLAELLILHWRTLRNLSLANAQITDEMLAILIERTQYHPLDLTHLDLSKNFLTDASIELIAKKFLSNNSSLQILQLSHNQIGRRGLAILAESIAKAKSLSIRIIDLEGNLIHIGIGELEDLRSLFSKCRHLDSIRLAGNSLQESVDNQLILMDNKSVAKPPQSESSPFAGRQDLFRSRLISLKSVIQPDKNISSTQWAVYLAAKNGNLLRQHAALYIAGVRPSGQMFIKRYHLLAQASYFYGRGKVAIEDLDPMVVRNHHIKNHIFVPFAISHTQGEALEARIKQKTQNIPFLMFPSVQMNRANCLSWARDQLTAINVELPEQIQTAILPSTAVAAGKDRKELSSAPMPVERMEEKNRVVIRIWTSEHNLETPGEDVGHVSIETAHPKAYVSLWPATPVDIKRSFSGILYAAPPDFKSNYQQDRVEERRNPEVTICLYSLNAHRLCEKFEEIKKSPKFKGWILSGGNIINNHSGESCASLAYSLLETAGIPKLLAEGEFSLDFSSISTPDDLAALVKTAKYREIQKHPETEGFKFQEETEVDDLSIGTYKTDCIIL